MNRSDELWRRLEDAEDRKTAFIEYVEEVIRLQEAGESYSEAGYRVCGTGYFEELRDDSGISQMIDIACDLEVPVAHRDKSRQNKRDKELWEEIKGLLEIYKAQNL